MKGKLIANFFIQEHFGKFPDDEVLGFDKFYGTLSKWAINQDKLSYEDFAHKEDEEQRGRELEAFKKMTDRMI